MVDVDAALDQAGLKNVQVREYVRFWAELTGAGRVEAISAADDARLIEDALMAGEVLPRGRWAVVLAWLRQGHRPLRGTHVRRHQQPCRPGGIQQLAPSGEMRASLEDRMRGASAGKTMYVVPYLMAAPGSPLDASPDDIETMLTIDTQRWRQEIAHRETAPRPI